MKIKVTAPATKVLYPDIGDNLSLPEEDRFAIVLYRPPKHKLYHAVRNLGAGEFAERDVDLDEYCKAHIKALRNPITLDYGDKQAVMRIGDLFEHDVFTETVAEVLQAANSFYGTEGQPEGDPKN